MKIRYLLIATVLLAPLAGCKTPKAIEAMERELRYQEDMIYDLQAYLETYKSHLEACRAENISLGGSAADRSASNGDTPTSRSNQPEEIPPETNGGNGNGNGSGGPALPEIELPEGFSSTYHGDLNQPLYAQAAQATTTSDDNIFEVIEVEEGEPLPTETRLVTAEAEVRPDAIQPPPVAAGPEAVAQLTLNAQRTGPYDRDDQPGVDGVQVWIEPRGASGDIVRADGEVTIAVLDASRPPQDNIVARWKIKHADLRRNQSPDGIQLKLRWPDERPDVSDAIVFVRMVTMDGLWIYSDQSVDLEGELIDTQAVATRPATVPPNADELWDRPQEPVRRVETASNEEADDRPPQADDTPPQADDTPPQTSAGRNPLRPNPAANRGGKPADTWKAKAPEPRLNEPPAPDSAKPAKAPAVKPHSDPPVEPPPDPPSAKPQPAAPPIDVPQEPPAPAKRTKRPQWRPHR